MNWNAYWRLARFDKPAGILLLWCPTAWALWLANKGMPPLKLFWLFLMGTILMRAAGCIINDIVDRRIDKFVKRTKARPITSGELCVQEALVFLGILLFAALIVLLNLPWQCVNYALLALAITVFYPFCKRFLQAPQLVLGLAFSMGIPMAYVASQAPFDSQFILLCLINFLWIVAYDTMYAMADREDDLKIGVKSTAIYFANYDRVIIGLLQLSLQGLWLLWGSMYHAGLGFYCLWFIAGGILIYQQQLISQRNPQTCFKAFLMSVYYGLLIWLAIILA